MSQPIARKGDTIDHGGEILDGSPDVWVNGRPVARVGDRVRCDRHGIVTIVDGNPHLPINGRDCARVGSRCSCGAVVTTGSPNIHSNR